MVESRGVSLAPRPEQRGYSSHARVGHWISHDTGILAFLTGRRNTAPSSAEVVVS